MTNISILYNKVNNEHDLEIEIISLITKTKYILVQKYIPKTNTQFEVAKQLKYSISLIFLLNSIIV